MERNRNCLQKSCFSLPTDSHEWLYAQDEEDLPVGTLVMTPSNALGVIIKHRAGASRQDGCSRVVGRYVGGSAKNLFTLQPNLLRFQREENSH